MKLQPKVATNQPEILLILYKAKIQKNISNYFAQRILSMCLSEKIPDCKKSKLAEDFHFRKMCENYLLQQEYRVITV